jgi:hypothetical protein
VLLGVEINPISMLKVVVDARIDSRKLADHGTIGFTRIAPLVQVSLGKLTAHARGDIIIQNDDTGTDKANYQKTTSVETWGDAIIACRIGGAYQVTGAANAYLQLGSDNISWIDGNGFYAKLGTKITLGTASIEIFDKVNQIGAAELTGASGDYSPINNQFQIDLNWTF